MAARTLIPSLTLVAVMAGVSHAQQVEIPFDMSMSNMTVDLAIAGSSDSDTSPLSGSILIDIEDFMTPSQFSVLDLSIAATETIDHNISFGILGGFSQESDNVTVMYESPGSPSMPAFLEGENFTIPSLNVLFGGAGDYNATGLVCSLISDQGLPCDGMLDFGALGGSISVENVSGQLAFSEGVVEIFAQIALTVPFDPEDPGLGQITVNASVFGTTTLPETACLGDCDDSRTVDFNDLVAMLFEFGNDSGSACDADQSGVVDFNDLVSALFLFGPCS